MLPWAVGLVLSSEEFLSDTEAALKLKPDLDFAPINLGLARLACGRDPTRWRSIAKPPKASGVRLRSASPTCMARGSSGSPPNAPRLRSNC
jgi:hypothetical protein